VRTIVNVVAHCHLLGVVHRYAHKACICLALAFGRPLIEVLNMHLKVLSCHHSSRRMAVSLSPHEELGSCLHLACGSGNMTVLAIKTHVQLSFLFDKDTINFTLMMQAAAAAAGI